MKRHPNIILLLALVMAVLFFASACGNEPEAGGGSGSGDSTPQAVTMPVEKETGKQRLIELGADDPARDVSYKGFKIKVTMTEGTDTTVLEIGGSDAIYWLAADGNGNGLLDLSEYSYFLDREGKSWTYRFGSWMQFSESEGTLMGSIFNGAVDALLYGAYESAMQAHMAFVEKTTLGGRNCSVYSTSVTVGEQTQTLKFWIDDEFGITLKMEYTGVSSVEYTIDAKINGTLSTGSGYPSYIPSDFPDGYEGIYNQTDTYIRTGRTVSDFAGTWNFPSGLGGGTLTITSGGTATLNQNSTDYSASLSIDGMTLQLQITDANILAIGFLAAPETMQTFSLKDVFFIHGDYEQDHSTLTFTKKN